MELSHKVVGRYVARGAVPLREKEDVENTILEKFLSKQDKIDKSFKSKSKKTTYYIAILNRMCAEVIRKEQKNWYSINSLNNGELKQESSTSFETEKQTLIKEEIKRFNACLQIFNQEKSKLILFLKYYFNIPLNKYDINNYAGKNSNEVQFALKGNNSLAKAEKNERLANVVLIVEQKNISGDAVRMWINKQIDILLNKLNFKQSRFHNRESLAVLLEINDSIEKNKYEL